MLACKTTALCKTYYKEEEAINSLQNCNLEIYTGECVAICGHIAAGKTTLLRILGGMERPTSGAVYINSNEVSTFNDDQLTLMRRSEIGYLFHSSSLILELNVHENIIVPALLAHKKYNRDYYQKLIERFDLQEIVGMRPIQLTPQQRQAVLYARILINNPKIIIMDEINGFDQPLDIPTLDILFQLIYEQKKTLIMAMNEVHKGMSVNHIIRLEQGEVIEDRRRL